MIIAAAVLSVLLALGHSVVGERFIISRLLRRPDLPKLFGSDVLTKRTLRFAWHVTSVMAVGIGAAMIAVERGSLRDAMLFLAMAHLASAIVALVGSRGQHPAWVVLLTIGVLAWLGAPPAP